MLPSKSLLLKKRKELTRYRSTGPLNQQKLLMSTQLDNSQPTPFDDAFFQHNLPQYYRAILQSFRKVTSSFITFHLIFWIALSLEICLFLPLIAKPPLFALTLGVFFLTGFTYIVLLFYFQAKKPEQLIAIRDQFLESCRHLLPSPPGEAQHHLSLAAALLKLSTYLDDFETRFYTIPPYLQLFTPMIQRFSHHCYHKDIFRMQQLLLHAATDEHLKQIRITPTDLEVHASLANTYVDLSQLYAGNEQFDAQYKNAAKLAIEEFRILSHYAPHDPWVHEQLADGYRAMKMAREETEEVELLAKLRPQDPETLLRLGSLYFELEENAKGLKIYEELVALNYKKGEELIALYGSRT